MSYKDPSFEALCEELCQLTHDIGLQLSDEQLDLLVTHLLLVLNKNQTLNLTRITDKHEALRLHVIDSLLLYVALLDADHQDLHKDTFIDIGTGAGYPGIPFGIASSCPGLLIDSSAKKITAVNEFISQLKLDIPLRANHIRAEELARTNYSASIVLARAVSSLNSLLEYAAPLLTKNGLLVAAKGNPKPEEIHDASYAASVCGFTLYKVCDYLLPIHNEHRSIYIYQKVKKPLVKLPRNTGMAQHHPFTQVVR